MNKNMFDYICCPKCRADFSQRGDSLICENCAKKYEIKEGIPILTDLELLPKHYARQNIHFEKVASKMHGDLKAWQQSYMERFKTNFSDIENKLVIDCGAGSGYMAIELAKLGATVIACDLNLKSLFKIKNIAEKLFLMDKVILLYCSAEELPLRNSIANYFISNSVLEHILNEKEAIQEINRVCCKKAGLMIAVPLKAKFLNPLLIPASFINDKKVCHLRRYDEKTLMDRFNNWRLIRTYYTGHSKKIIKVFFNKFGELFDTDRIEKEDRKKENKRYGAYNIICFFRNG